MKRSGQFPWIRILLFVLIIALVSACGGGGNTEAPADSSGTGDTGESSAEGAHVIVASKDFTEQFILGNMYRLLLEDAGFDIEYKQSLGGTPVAHAALESGEIDLYPEYTGTGLLTVLKLPVKSDPEAVYQTVSEQYASNYNLAWLEPAPMNNTQALAMNPERAEELGITTISDMVANANDLIMVGPDEFPEREDGLPGLKRVYGDFELNDYKAVDKGLRYQALVNGQADVAVAFSTDGEINAFDLMVLEDDQNLFPPYQVAPVVRQEMLDAHPEIATVLNQLAPKLTNEAMQRMNYQVSGEEQEPAEVARAFLVEAGLLAE